MNPARGPVQNPPPVAYGLYLHIPFCRSKCAYCDFNSYAGLEPLFPAYARALIREIEAWAPAQARTVYVGGGTPTVLPPDLLAEILGAVRRAFSLPPGAEISVEANPGTVDAPALERLRALGVNRLSLGVQSFHDEELALLGRIHTADQAVEALSAARWAGLENVGLDLIYGLPGQSLAAWQQSLARALELRPEHLSLYALSLEECTPLAARVARGELPAPDPDLAADMYDWAEEACAAAGYHHYEISNWARAPELACQHNLVYWRNEPYLGLGAGAHSWAAGVRWSNVAAPDEYVARVEAGTGPRAEEEPIPAELEMAETMIMGLRLLDEGVSVERFRARFGLDPRRHYGPQVAELEALGLVEASADRVRLTRRGHLLANQALYRFLPG